jgi:hypothetical protein
MTITTYPHEVRRLAITDVGLELDHKLAALPAHLGAPVRPALAT